MTRKSAQGTTLRLFIAFMLMAAPGFTQQITGTPGSPSATMTIQGDQIPPPLPKFGGKIERNAAQSKPYWPARVEPRRGAPNVLLIITDDTGYGTPSTFGGVIPTPTPTRAALITQGGRFGGYGFYVLKDKPVFLWNLVDMKRVRWEGPDALTPGPHTLEFDFKYDGLGMGTLAFNNLSGIGRSGTGVLKVDGKVVAEQKMEPTIPLILQWDENLDVGSDTLTGVDDRDYQPPFAFTGKLNKVTRTIDRPKLTPEDEKRLMQGQRNNRVSE